jgi:hypothetical protein
LHGKLRRFDLDRYGAVTSESFTHALKLAKVPLSTSRTLDLFADLDVRGLGKVLQGKKTCPNLIHVFVGISSFAGIPCGVLTLTMLMLPAGGY